MARVTPLTSSRAARLNSSGIFMPKVCSSSKTMLTTSRESTPSCLNSRTQSASLNTAAGVVDDALSTAHHLKLRAGEVVGLSGLLGSGRTELVKLIFGAIKPDSGALSLKGGGAAGSNPRASLDAGIVLCPEDRKSEGLVGELSIRENIILSMQAKRGWMRKVPRAEQEKIADEMIAALAVATPDAEKPVRQLSGGNQQKIVLGKWLLFYNWI